MFKFIVAEGFVKSLHKLDNKVQQEVKKKLHFLSNLKKPLFFAKKLTGRKNVFRFRMGDYRIVFKLEKQEIILLLVKHRKDVYDKVF